LETGRNQFIANCGNQGEIEWKKEGAHRKKLREFA